MLNWTVGPNHCQCSSPRVDPIGRRRRGRPRCRCGHTRITDAGMQPALSSIPSMLPIVPLIVHLSVTLVVCAAVSPGARAHHVGLQVMHHSHAQVPDQPPAFPQAVCTLPLRCLGRWVWGLMQFDECAARRRLCSWALLGTWGVSVRVGLCLPGRAFDSCLPAACDGWPPMRVGVASAESRLRSLRGTPLSATRDRCGVRSAG